MARHGGLWLSVSIVTGSEELTECDARQITYCLLSSPKLLIGRAVTQYRPHLMALIVAHKSRGCNGLLGLGWVPVSLLWSQESDQLHRVATTDLAL